MKLRLPSGISLETFLSDYWQRQPLYMPDALREYDFPLTPEELAGLACEEALESRLVTGHGDSGWTLRNGPFDEETFLSLPEENWTLLVQDVDKFLPEVARLLEPFGFIPSWRFDDVMVSYATPGGSVGPHIDTYDVFLVQGSGLRRWMIDPAPASKALIPDPPVRILAHFEPKQEWVLKQGDVLYLPPGVAHWGVAETPTMNWSVGLRAPAHQELLDSFAQFLLERMPAEAHYEDPAITPTDQPGMIPASVYRHTFEALDRWLTDESLREHWLGSFMTEAKPHLVTAPPDEPVSGKMVHHKLLEGARLQRHPFARLAWSRRGGGGSWLFASGEARATELPETLLEQLCSAPVLDRTQLPPAPHLESWLELLAELFNQGQLEWRHE